MRSQFFQMPHFLNRIICYRYCNYMLWTIVKFSKIFKTDVGSQNIKFKLPYLCVRKLKTREVKLFIFRQKTDDRR